MGAKEAGMQNSGRHLRVPKYDEASFILGIDTGGTSSVALAVNLQGEVVSSATDLAVNYTLMKRNLVSVRLKRLITKTVGNYAVNCVAVSIGLAGWRADAQRFIEDLVQKIGIAGKVFAFSDIEGSWVGATGGRPGVVASSGTGSWVCGKLNPEEEWHFGLREGTSTICVDGLGPLLGDEGSAYDIGRSILRYVAASLDGRQSPGRLTEVVLQELKARSLDEMIFKIYTEYNSRHSIALLAPLADQCAKENDEAARSILQAAARRLANSTKTALSSLRNLSGQLLPVFYSGGVFNAEEFRKSFVQSVREEFPNAIIREERFPPVVGTVLKAYRSMFGNVPEKFTVNLPRGRDFKFRLLGG